MKCPKCKQAELDYPNGYEHQDEQVSYKVACPKCGFTGREWHKLVFEGFTDENGNDVPTTPGPEGVELSDGGIIEWPDEAGEIRRRDQYGNTEEVRKPGDKGHDEWFNLFATKMVLTIPRAVQDDSVDDGAVKQVLTEDNPYTLDDVQESDDKTVYCFTACHPIEQVRTNLNESLDMKGATLEVNEG